MWQDINIFVEEKYKNSEREAQSVFSTGRYSM
jgi:hypothetical protein